MNQLRRDLQDALARLDRMSVSGAGRTSTRRRRRGAGVVARVENAASLPPPQPRRRRARTRRPRNGLSVAEGELTITKSELVKNVITSADGSARGLFGIVPDEFPYLKSLFGAFERVKWHSFACFYKPAVGTTVGGLITYGIDWDREGTNVRDRTQVSAYTPTTTTSIWCDNSARPLVAQQAKLAGRLWYTPRTGDSVDKGPGDLVYACNGPASSTVGELWVTYRVTMAGTRSA